ncbi:hypothetical protein C8A03DRAFT_38596 [Achaetomium macrosporum]|uniref:Uncharacterized protein n=1 Tax=Achaetomium macrosporum TaxID=79813 RepID=A0AAN7C278_9PEZI|nr:hypothetical protein C8A03DRAFT_38596 [Achaetomium macrosporum]
MNPNPLSDREKALEDQWIREKEKQMAKEKAAKKETSKDTDTGSVVKKQEQAGQAKK